MLCGSLRLEEGEGELAGLWKARQPRATVLTLFGSLTLFLSRPSILTEALFLSGP